jgi:CHAT domain-containing protein
MHEERKSPEYLQQALGEMGNAYILSGRYKDAIPLLRRAMTVAQEAKRDSYAGLWASSLAYAHIELGEWDLAEQFNSEAGRLRSDARNRPYQVLNDAQIAEGRGDVAAAYARYNEALKIGRDDPMVVRVVHAGLGRLDIAAGKWPRGSVTTRLRSIPSSGRVSISRRPTIDCRSSRGSSNRTRSTWTHSSRDRRSSRPLSVADSSRGRVLAERQGANVPARPSPAVFRSAAADLRGVLLFYWIGTKRSYAWAVTQDRIRFTALGVTKAEVETMVRGYQEFLVSSIGDPLAASHGPGDELYQKLIAPLASWIPRGSAVIVVPDGAAREAELRNVARTGDRRHYWIDDVQVAVAPALGVLKPVGAVTRRRAIGAPHRGCRSADSKYPALRYASAEMARSRARSRSRRRCIAPIKRRRRAISNRQPARYEIVHFTAHADATPRARSIRRSSCRAGRPATSCTRVTSRRIHYGRPGDDLCLSQRGRAHVCRRRPGRFLVGVPACRREARDRGTVGCRRSIDGRVDGGYLQPPRGRAAPLARRCAPQNSR